VIKGRVFHYRPTVELAVYGPSGQSRIIKAVVDTGFTGDLVLPQTEVAALGLQFLIYDSAVLADGSGVPLSVHEATILWHGVQRHALILAAGQEPLLGMSLIYGSRLTLEGEDGGALTLDELP
jgi:clan AA aspartic protease